MKNNLKKYGGLFIFSLLSLVIIPFFGSKAEALTVITSSLSIGSHNGDVTTLQTFLATDSTIYPEARVTGYYGSLTAAAVRRFQARYSIATVGRVGPQTRAKINEFITNGGFGNGSTGGGGSVSADAAPYIFAVATALSPQTTTTTGTTYTTSTTTGSTATSTATTTTTTTQTQNNVVVSWQTDKAARGKVFYSTTPLVFSETNASNMEPVIGGNVMTDNTYSTVKSITLSNLWTSGASGYYYMIEAIDANGNVSVTWPRMFNSAGVSVSQ